MKKRNWKKKLAKFGKGSISLFLAMLMTPFMSIALALVETQRYNSVVSILDEAMGSSAISTLANYDKYLANRWGLYAVDQSMNARDLYYTYLKPNSKLLGKGLKIEDFNSVTVNGAYSLADMEIFEQQIMEFCKLNIPMQAGTNLANTCIEEISDLTGLGDALKSLDVIEAFINTLTQSINVLDTTLQGIKTTIELISSIKKLVDMKDQLNQNYNTLKTDYNNLKTTITDLEQKKIELYEEKAKLEAEESKSKPSDKLVKQYRNNISSIENDIAELENKIQNYQNKIFNSETGSLKAYEKNIESMKNGTEFTEEVGDELVSNVEGFAMGLRDLAKDKAKLEMELEDARQKKDEIDKQKDDINKEIKQKKKDYAGDKEGLERDPEYSKLKEKSNELKKQSIILKNEIKQKDNLIKQDLHKDTIAIDVFEEAAEGASECIDQLEQEIDNQLENGDDPNAIGFYKTMYNAASDSLDQIKEIRNKWSETTTNGLFDSDGNKTVYCDDFLQAADEFVADDNPNHNTLIREFTNDQIEKMKKDLLQRLDNILGITAIIKFIKSAASLFTNNIIEAFFQLYNLSLVSEIDTDFYNSVMGGLPGNKALASQLDQHLKGVIEGIKLIKVGVDEISGLDTSGNVLEKIISHVNPFSKLNGLKNIAIGSCKFISNVVGILSDFLNDYMDPSRLAIALYAVYNCPCRTDYVPGTDEVKFKPITGGSFDPKSLPSNTILGQAVDLDSMLQSMNRGSIDRGSSDSTVELTFSAAELEYMLFGTYNEAVNQMFTYILMYAIRLLMSFPTMFIDQESCEIISACNIFCFIPIIIYAIAEPMLDMALLTKGADVKFFKTKMYLSSTGIIDFLTAYMKACQGEMMDALNVYKCFNSDQAEKIENDVKNYTASTEEEFIQGMEQLNTKYASSSSTDGASSNIGSEISSMGKSMQTTIGSFLPKGFLSMSYKDYCKVFLVLFSPKITLLYRLMNLVQMEGTYNSLCGSSPKYVWSEEWQSTGGQPTVLTSIPAIHQKRRISATRTASGKTLTGQVKTGQEQILIFDLRKAYTFIDIEVETDVQQIMPSLIDSSLFKVTRKACRGY